MLIVADAEIKRKIAFQNPWWGTGKIEPPFDGMRPRPYIKPFLDILVKKDPHRAVVLVGPRRIGKTVMLYHTAKTLMESGTLPRDIIYFSLDDPNFSAIALEKLLQLALGERFERSQKGIYVFFDEIQYFRNWEVHLKSLVDQYRGIKFVASGSAAAALRMKSGESGAGRFTDFLLPPLTFYEYMVLLGKENPDFKENINLCNRDFINYINYGGFPEAIFSPEIQANPQKYIGSDIIDKVLLRDLPGLYGIQDTQELNRLFASLAYNTANEVSLDELSKNSGVAKQTVKRYIDYLEAAFLIKKLPRIGDNGKVFKRERNFKVHLTNPSMRAALYGPVDEGSDALGHLVETAIFSQHLHAHFDLNLFYARWKDGEVDMVRVMGRNMLLPLEVKWSDSVAADTSKLKSLLYFMNKTGTKDAAITTKTITDIRIMDGKSIIFFTSSYYCHEVGRNLIEARSRFITESLASL